MLNEYSVHNKLLFSTSCEGCGDKNMKKENEESLEKEGKWLWRSAKELLFELSDMLTTWQFNTTNILTRPTINPKSSKTKNCYSQNKKFFKISIANLDLQVTVLIFTIEKEKNLATLMDLISFVKAIYVILWVANYLLYGSFFLHIFQFNS